MKKGKTIALSCIIFLAPLAVNAGIINSAGNGFNDLGGSTIDLQTNLEWKDMTHDNRSQCDVMYDIGGSVLGGCTANDGLDLYNDADGWRYATHSELAALFNNWTGLPIPGYGATDIGSAFAGTWLSVFAPGTADLRADLIPHASYAANPNQATGFRVSTTGFLQAVYANGGINYDKYYAAALVRQATVPTPAPMALMGLGLAAIGWRRKVKAKR